jgi:putative phosphonate catabolism associated alcohol dehydrogenase
MNHSCTVALFEGTGKGFSNNTFELEPLDTAEVLVAVTACALCGSDLHTIAGRRSCRTPILLGHEIVGRVVDTGGPVNDWSGRTLQAGDRITWSIAASCGTCFYCRRELPQKCESLVKYGHAEGESLEHDGARGPLGGLTTHCRLVPGTAIFTIPDTLDDKQAAPANCCTATSVAAVRLAGDVQDANLLVMGAGSLGVTVTEYALHQGAASVVLADIDAKRLHAAESIDGCTTLALDSPGQQLPDPIREHTDGRGVDIAIDVSGATSAIQSALDWLRIGGHAILVGSVFQSPPLALDTESVVRRMLTISGLHNYQPIDLAQALDFLAQLPNNALSRSLVGPTFSLHDIDQAVAAADSAAHLRVVVTPTTEPLAGTTA